MTKNEEVPEQSEFEVTVLFEPDNPLPDFTFDDLPGNLKARVKALGWTHPMPVQRKAIPYLLEKRDMIVQARTGSGKTGAYLLPILEHIKVKNEWCQALVLVPTRELARQVFSVLKELTEGTDIRSVLVYGGVGYGTQVRELKAGGQIVVGTPGRILDLIFRGTFSVQRVNMLVLDEADEMLSMGFYPSMRKLKRQLPRERQTWLFSATMPYHVEQLAHEFLHEPDRLSLSKGTQSVSNLDHHYYIVPPLQKDRVLIQIIEMENPDSAIIFTNTKKNAEYLSTVLKTVGIDAQHLTGDLTQNKRERIMDQLRGGTLRFLIATDVAARGLDISDLSHVFLYDIPEHTEVYIHRSGRTARAGKTGRAITLCESVEERKLLAIAKQYSFQIEQHELPTDEQLAERVSERLTVYLEGKLNSMSMLEQERLQMFAPMLDNLLEDDDLRVLLTMLLDHAYSQGLHTQLYTPETATEAPKQRKQNPKSRGETSRKPGSRRDGRKQDRR